MELKAASQVVVGTEQDTNVWEDTQHGAFHMTESQKAQAEMTLKKVPVLPSGQSHWEGWMGHTRALA